jgi:hypothetical protein
MPSHTCPCKISVKVRHLLPDSFISADAAMISFSLSRSLYLFIKSEKMNRIYQLYIRYTYNIASCGNLISLNCLLFHNTGNLFRFPRLYQMTYLSLIGFTDFYFSALLLECLSSFSFPTSFHNVNNETCQENFLISNSGENFRGLIM